LLFISPTNAFLIESLNRITEFSNFIEIKNKIASFLVLFNPKYLITQESSHISKWAFENFPDFFANNCDFSDFNESLFFFHGQSFKCFPLTAFLNKFLFHTSKMVSVTDFPIEFEHSDGDFTYVSVQSNFRENTFTISSTHESTVTSHASIIVHGNKFSLFGQTPAIVCWRSVNQSTLISRIHNCFSRWRLNFSHQLVLSASAELTEIIYNKLPMSIEIEFEFALCCAQLLRNRALKFLENHTLGFHCRNRNKKKKNQLEKKPKNDEEFAGICGERIGSEVPMQFTVKFEVWREICREGTVLNRIFRESGFEGEVTPVFLRWKVAAVSGEGVRERIRFCEVQEEVKLGIEEWVEGAPDGIVLYFIEWITGEWGMAALIESKIPEITIVGVEGNVVRVFPNQHVLEIGRFDTTKEVIRAVLTELQTFLDQQYG
jgi:hypothetical protein